MRADTINEGDVRATLDFCLEDDLDGYLLVARAKGYIGEKPEFRWNTPFALGDAFLVEAVVEHVMTLDAHHLAITPVMRGHRGRERQKKAAASAGGVIWADIDKRPPEQFEDPELLRGFERLLVASGGGTHVYYRLDRCTPAGELEAAVQGLQLALDSDSAVAHAGALMRLPGTRNFKYDPPQLSRIVEVRRGDLVTPEVLQELAATSETSPRRPGRLRTRRNSRRAPRDRLGVEPVPNELRTRLSSRSLRLLEERPGDDRSAQTYAATGSLLADGFDDDEIAGILLRFHAPTIARANEGKDVEDDIERCLGKLLDERRRTQLAVIRFLRSALSPLTTSQSMRSRVSLGKAAAGFGAKVLELGSLEVDLSVRELAQLMGIQPSPAGRLLQRLTSMGTLELGPPPASRCLSQGYRLPKSHASQDQEEVVEVGCVTDTSVTDPCPTCLAAIKDAGHDAFRHGALGAEGWVVWLVLSHGPMSWQEIESILGDGVWRVLSRCADKCLVVRQRRTWRLSDVCLDDLARRHGSAGTGRRQVVDTEVERARYHGRPLRGAQTRERIQRTIGDRTGDAEIEKMISDKLRRDGARDEAIFRNQERRRTRPISRNQASSGAERDPPVRRRKRA